MKSRVTKSDNYKPYKNRTNSTKLVNKIKLKTDGAKDQGQWPNYLDFFISSSTNLTLWLRILNLKIVRT